MVDRDFQQQMLLGYRLTTIHLLYYFPDYQHLLQQFMWQTLDLSPKFPRIQQFLNYWKINIPARIKDYDITYVDDITPTKVHKVDFVFPIKCPVNEIIES
jgi:uncharacterized protein Usg